MMQITPPCMTSVLGQGLLLVYKSVGVAFPQI
jgi:hypothetical protein